MAKSRPTLTIKALENAFESIGEGAFIVGTDGRVVRANKIALKMLGYKASELIGQRFIDRITALNLDRKPISPINRPLVRSVISGRPIHEYLYYQGKANSGLPVYVSASPIIENGQPIGIINIFRDISLEEAIDRMKSEFISLASHQLRTPLSSIKTYSHMLLEGYMGDLADQQRSALEIIVTSTNRMNELISTLLNITRLESGAIVVQNDITDLFQLAKEVVEEMEIPAKNSGIYLELSIKDRGSTKIRSDGPIIKEVISNLVSNSIKYSKEGGRVKVMLRPTKEQVTITVSDDGLGIPPAARPQIFSKFFRARNVIEQETNGTGLGLYLVKGLVDQLGGSITFTSEVNKGTTFKVKLPRHFMA